MINIIVLALWAIITSSFSIVIILEYFIGFDSFWVLFFYHYGFANNVNILRLHIIGTIIIFLLGPLQLANLKYKYRLQKYHPYIGTIYMVGINCIIFSWILFGVYNRVPGEYVILIPCSIYPGLLIIYSSIALYSAIKRFPAHKYWAVRLYMLAMAPIIYRIFYLFVELQFAVIYYWLFFMIPIVYAEIYLMIQYRGAHLKFQNEDDLVHIYKPLVSGDMIYPS